MQRRPTVGPGSQKAPFRERLPGTISKLGKGTALQRLSCFDHTVFYICFGTFESSGYGSGLFDYFFWQKSLVELITSGSAGTWPVLFRNTVDFRPGHCSVDFRQIP